MMPISLIESGLESSMKTDSAIRPEKALYATKPRGDLQGEKYHGIGCCCSVTLLRRHTVHLPAPVFRNRNSDAICGLRPTTGGQAAGSSRVVSVGSDLHRGELHR